MAASEPTPADCGVVVPATVTTITDACCPICVRLSSSPGRTKQRGKALDAGRIPSHRNSLASPALPLSTFGESHSGLWLCFYSFLAAFTIAPSTAIHTKTFAQESRNGNNVVVTNDRIGLVLPRDTTGSLPIATGLSAIPCAAPIHIPQSASSTQHLRSISPSTTTACSRR